MFFWNFFAVLLHVEHGHPRIEYTLKARRRLGERVRPSRRSSEWASAALIPPFCYHLLLFLFLCLFVYFFLFQIYSLFIAFFEKCRNKHFTTSCTLYGYVAYATNKTWFRWLWGEKWTSEYSIIMYYFVQYHFGSWSYNWGV